ncbi:hypothetical protein B0H67DRAFT_495317 [Lasiosphaeris hirsuta]|uniref:F-box domain-containing protein n=1 Tax=Lasiosphaeris hirsuta TaxID=260670 RepID=A0AA40DPU2_9PEZI|nr:hypothetical protein B0H67DRAFT_495317 [Lasiosphaeris hirsuta]
MTRTKAVHNSLPVEVQHSALLQLLGNSLVLSHTTPYMSCKDILNLATTSRAFHYLIHHTPQVFRRLDLGSVKTAQFEIGGIDRGGESWRNAQVDENVTEDDFYSGPLRGIFSNLRRHDILRHVQILILDGLSVTAELVHNVLVDPAFSVRILSIRQVNNLNERMLRAALQYACRDSRPEGTPRLKGLYVFGPKDSDPDQAPSTQTMYASVAAAFKAQGRDPCSNNESEAWYVRRGAQCSRVIDPEWASTFVACNGIIAFDAILCTGPRHLNSSAWGSVNTTALNAADSQNGPPTKVPHYAVATHSVDGCAGCGSAPEGWTVWGEIAQTKQRDQHDRRDSRSTSAEIGRYPLLAPPPRHSINPAAAMCPAGQSVQTRISSLSASKHPKAKFIPRCSDCLEQRYCRGCHRWWCEACYIPAQEEAAKRVSKPVPYAISPGSSDTSDPILKVLYGFCARGGCWFVHWGLLAVGY